MSREAGVRAQATPREPAAHGLRRRGACVRDRRDPRRDPGEADRPRPRRGARRDPGAVAAGGQAARPARDAARAAELVPVLRPGTRTRHGAVPSLVDTIGQLAQHAAAADLTSVLADSVRALHDDLTSLRRLWRAVPEPNAPPRSR